MVTTLCGENTFEVRQALDTVVTAFVQQHGANAVERLEGAATTVTQLREAVSAVSLFAPQRLVVLKNPSANKELFAALDELVSAVPDGSTLVVVDGSLDKRTKTYKTLKAATDFREFAALSEPQLLKWMQQKVSEGKGEMTPAAARLLLEYVGTDQWQLASEIEKLLACQSKITEETIRALVTPNLQASAFALLDAALAGRAEAAQRQLRQLRASSDPYEFFGLLVWQANALALVAAAPKMSSAELASQSGLKPFVVQKSQGLVGRMGTAKVRAIVEVLATLDMQLKSTGVEPWLLVAQALDKITTVQGARV